MNYFMVDGQVQQICSINNDTEFADSTGVCSGA
jgi:hypothetical protein